MHMSSTVCKILVFIFMQHAEAGFTPYAGQDCVGRNVLGQTIPDTRNDCVRRCSQDASCLSVEYYSGSGGKCSLSSSCTAAHMRTESVSSMASQGFHGVTLYVKNRARKSGDTCRYAHDGECDEPQFCETGTDCSDCNTCGGKGTACASPPFKYRAKI
jgi:hypothetical protein